MNWQKRARVVLALIAVATVAGVLMTIRKREPPSAATGITRVDPKAVAESAGGQMTQATGMKIPGFIDYERSLMYEDGSIKFIKPKLTTTRAGREFLVVSNEGQLGADQAHMRLAGDVVLTGSDGLRATTQEATYSSGEDIVRAPGKVDFSKGNLSGSGVGMSYDQQRGVMWLLDQANITVKPDGSGDPGMRIVSGAAGLARRDKYFRFERGFSGTRNDRVLSADMAMAYMTEDEKALESLELRGNSRITVSGAAEGALQAMTARDINLKYATDGETLEHALLAGTGVIQFAGAAGQPGRRFAGEIIDIAFGPDGAVTTMTMRDAVQVTLPASKDVAEKTIRAASMDGTGEPGKGLTGARFTDNVEFREVLGPNQVRIARSRTLSVVMAQGGGIDDARFGGGTAFEDGALRAQSQDARYLVGRGQLELTGAIGPKPPHVEDERLTVDATTIALTFEGPKMLASGDVKSVLRPPKKPAAGAKPGEQPHVPGMLKDDRETNVTGAKLDYDGTARKAIYTGAARLWQGDTAISGDTITIDEQSGDLYASGNVRSTLTLEQLDSKTKEKKKVPTISSARDLHYEDALRRATYTTDAHVNGPQGDLRGVKIELYLVEGGGALERAEAYDDVKLLSDARTATGARMTYFAADEKYIMTGSPVRTIDEKCRETTGKTLTFWRSTDRILVDGNEQIRTLTLSGGTCSQASQK